MKIIVSGLSFIWVLSFLFISCEENDVIDNPSGGQQQDLATKFLGTWSVDDQPSRLNYMVTIERHVLYEDRVKIKNFADVGGEVTGVILGNTLLIDKQYAGSGYNTEGTGIFISSKRLQFEFLLDDGIDIISRKAVYTK
jgi:hypothetical protein